jgi:D-2-hydroxyacid dehydrogenase (NADP+)
LIAISRGGIVDEDALANALNSGQIAGAGIDVTMIEPLPADSPLWDATNIIITPHLAGASGPKEQRCVQVLYDNIVRFAKGDELVNVVDKQAGY